MYSAQKLGEKTQAALKELKRPDFFVGFMKRFPPPPPLNGALVVGVKFNLNVFFSGKQAVLAIYLLKWNFRFQLE